MRSVLSLILLIVAVPIGAQTYDFVAAGESAECGIATPIVIPALEWYPGVDEVNTDVRTIAPLGDGRLVAALRTAGTTLVTIHPDRTRTPFFSTTLYLPEELAANAAGGVYVRTNGNPSMILAINPDGTLRDTMTLRHRAIQIELGADQCTLFYTHGDVNTPGAVSRYNVCSGEPMPDFVALPPGDTASTRVLPDGDVLLVRSNFSGSALQRYDAAGNLISTVGLPAGIQPDAVALSANGRRVLIGGGCTNSVFEFDVINGAFVREAALDLITSVDSLVSGNGFAAAIGPLAATQIPTASTAGLISLTALALLIALWRLSA